MTDLERLVQEAASRQHNLTTTAQAMELGMPKRTIAHRLQQKRWSPVHRGVHLIGPGPVTWLHRAHGAVLAAGPGAGLSHRAGTSHYELDGCSRGPIELSVPYPRHVAIPGVIVHRSKTLTPREVRLWSGVPVTRIERTLTEAAIYLPPRALEKAAESAFRRGLTSPSAVEHYLRDLGHVLPGARRLDDMLLARGADARVAGSPAEVELIACLRERGVEPPVRQYLIDLGGGWMIAVDLAWPWRRLIVEYYGVDAHASPAAVAYDYERENAIDEAGYKLRRYGGGMVRRNPDGTACEIAALIAKCPLVAPIGSLTPA